MRQGFCPVLIKAADWPVLCECHSFGENSNVRKRIVGSDRTVASSEPGQRWMDLGEIATVEVSSEDPAFPIESVFSANTGPGWRASEKGEQQIRLIFDQALAVRRIQLHFLEPTRDRLQEFTVRWSPAEGGQPKEIVRQQWNFSPPAATRETENYAVDLSRVTMLELTIDPDREHRTAKASLSSLRVA